MRKKWLGMGGLLAAGLLGAATLAGAASAASVEPILIPGADNVSCAELDDMYGGGQTWMEFKIDAPGGVIANGTYPVGTYGSITISNFAPANPPTAGSFDWSSTFGIDAVLVKTGVAGKYLYLYDPPPPESMGDTGLMTPTGQGNGFSHISFCYDYELAVSKTALTWYTRTWQWDIFKSVNPDFWALFKGDTGTSSWMVGVTKTGYVDSGWKVNGTITIVNPAPMAATITAVTDVISGVGAVTPSCGVTFPYTLAAGGTLTCSYMSALSDASFRVNTATVTTTGMVKGGTATADIVFGDPTTVVNDSINVTDTNGRSWGPVSETTGFGYSETFACDEDEGTHVNTATITETGQTATDEVDVVCYDLAVTKDATASFDREWQWEITKSVTPATLDMFTGDSGSVEYTVAVDKKGYVDTNFAVAGKIWINNPAPIPAMIKSVADVVSPDIEAAVTCPVTFPYSLGAGMTLECSYASALPDKASRVNTATATLQNYDYDPAGAASVGGTTAYTATANVVFGDTPAKVLYAEVNVTDTNGQSWGPVGDDASWKYSKTFTCDGDEGKHDNTATIVETKQSDDATVQVNCYALKVTKDAVTSFTRTWSWTIDKSADQTELLLSDGQLFQVNYQVKVDATYMDSDWAVAGTISITNPAPIPAPVTAVVETLPGATNLSLSCPWIGTPIPAGGTVTCTYSADLPNGETRTNTAQVVTPNATFTGTASVKLGDPTTEIDECIDVSDTNVGFLGKVCAADAPKTFNYSLWLGASPEGDVELDCGDFSHTNTASFVTNDTGATGSDSWTVTGTIACDYGCTLTPGYWKTHSAYGPAPYDDTWALLPAGENTPFFLSGKTYYQALWSAPSGGNAYYILAHAWIAAYLNVLNGASIPATVEAAWTDAAAWFSTALPSTKLSKADRAMVLGWAYLLDDYNNGYFGPGHCSE